MFSSVEDYPVSTFKFGRDRKEIRMMQEHFSG